MKRFAPLVLAHLAVLVFGVFLAQHFLEPVVIEKVVIKEILVEVPTHEPHTCITMDWMVRVKLSPDEGFSKIAEQVWCIHYESNRIGPTIEGLEDDEEIILRKQLFPTD